MKKIFSILSLAIAMNAYSQNPAPAVDQTDDILIMNGTAHIGDGKVIENSVIGIKKGKIILIGDATVVRINRNEFPIFINAKGKHIYPGLINMNSNIGLMEIELVRATRDYNETGELNPNVRSVIAYNTDSKITPTVRSNGVLMSQVVPQGGIISGQSSVVELDGWNWEDATYKYDEGIHVRWPRMNIVPNNPKETEEIQKQKIQNGMNAIELLFKEAKAYSLNSTPEEVNQKFEAMRGLFDRSKTLYVHCDYIREIVSSITMLKPYNLRIALVGGSDSYRVIDLLKANNISLVLGRTHALPPREDDDIDIVYRLPSILKKAGIPFAISVDGSWQTRNLMFNAGSTASYGLTKEEALEAVTLAPAKILGISDRVGTLEQGKDATLFISDGDALDMRTNNVTKAFIRGKEINLDNIQKQLYEKYMKKYGLN